MGQGIFGTNLFAGTGLGQAQASDFSDIAALAQEAVPKASSTTTGKASGEPAYLPAATTPGYTALPASDNTILYVVGGVAVVGLLAAMMLMGGKRRSVTSNRGRRGRRSRRRGR